MLHQMVWFNNICWAEFNIFSHQLLTKRLNIGFAQYFKKENGLHCYAGPVYWMHSDLADIGEKPLAQLADRQERNCHTTLPCEPRSYSPDQKCLLKTEQDIIRNEAQGFFISEPELSIAKQQFKPSVNQYRSTEHITVLTSTTYQTRSLQVTLLS